MTVPHPAPEQPTPAGTWPRLSAATAHLDTPLAALGLAALDRNAADLTARAAGKPVRVASKSVRVRAVLERVLALPGYAGVLAYSLPEALWLVREGVSDDVVVAYPTVDRAALRDLVHDPRAAAAITLVVDDPAHLDLVDTVAAPGERETVRLCLELDASLALPGLWVGVRRSPLRTADRAGAAARAIAARPGFALVGVMSYEAQLAGLGDRPPAAAPRSARARAVAVRRLQALSWRELPGRRAEAVAAVREVADLEFVNAGGTGSLERTRTDPSVTEVAAGSGLFGPGLFDGYGAFQPRPAVAFALDVVRTPAPGMVTVGGAGWVASGPPGPDRLPTIAWPPGLGYLANEAAGEVQTPLTGPGADRLRVGDRVWFRHAKAGELCERVTELHVVEGDRVTQAWPTYRGEGKTYG
ncbi:alanine racemase [Ornithinicoccus hortensis]|uniref:D-serine deaminase-like pyridoxal phosphate-dependent protein n=1 Tax=Ornithinicoccus hortensis TaxID=82346 RepID=A0A542YWK2_9MICO|nr:alanine racemase [Ornithinicoccus hortensis]TQL52354.1 D-serine deaminase-like pyridoxal phosphate-dependent protein [Ornithinicoccus hortensis]